MIPVILLFSIYALLLLSAIVAGGGSADDDASSWFVFAAILNFNTYPQSVFTMFEVTVLGSWSMVRRMDDLVIGNLIGYVEIRSWMLLGVVFRTQLQSTCFFTPFAC